MSKDQLHCLPSGGCRRMARPQAGPGRTVAGGTAGPHVPQAAPRSYMRGLQAWRSARRPCTQRLEPSVTAGPHVTRPPHVHIRPTVAAAQAVYSRRTMTLSRTLTLKSPRQTAPAGPIEHDDATLASDVPVAAVTDSSAARSPQAHDQEDVLKLWASQYHLPVEQAGTEHGAHVAARYRPPASDWPGILMACSVITMWAILFWHALFRVRLPSLDEHASAQPHSSWLHIVAAFLSLEFLYTGLFITTHDAMHGTIAMRNRKLNDFLGRVAISLYAWFDYDMLHRNHWRHHNHTGEVHKDPDFHRGNPAILPWFFRFMMEYSSLWQFTRIAYWSLLMQWLGAPMENIYVFMTAAPLLSAFRLFYHGTYVPHHPEPGTPDASTKTMGWALSRTANVPTLVSFLTCYHFDLHWEHHRWPYAPWWDLPRCRLLSGRSQKAPRKA